MGSLTSHTIGKHIFEDPRKLTVKVGYKTDYNYRVNERYFNPVETVGLGTTAADNRDNYFFFQSRSRNNSKIHPNKITYFRGVNF